MDIDKLTKTQFILLTLLVSFIVSLATAIVTATLVRQAPPPFTQSITKVVEKIIKPAEEKILLKEQAKPTIITQEDLVVNIVKEVSPAVVSVIATKDIPIVEQFFVNPFEDFQNLIPEELLPRFQIPQFRQKGTEKQQISSGSGFFISEDGLLLTNRHVIEDSSAEYSVILNDGKNFSAKILARDPIYDIAVLKIETKTSFISLSDSNKIRLGQTVIAIGNALGEFQNTISTGVVSGLRRTITAFGNASGPELLQELIQTDAAINPGNSGGPLLNLSGQVIGINTAMARGAENIGFATPINFAKKAVEDVKKFGKIRYPFLGVRYVIITPEIQKEKNLPVDYGVLIASTKGEKPIFEGSPAEKAGLKEGDIITEFNKEKISKNNTLALLISKHSIGEEIELKILREGKEAIIKATLVEMPESL